MTRGTWTQREDAFVSCSKAGEIFPVLFTTIISILFINVIIFIYLPCECVVLIGLLKNQIVIQIVIIVIISNRYSDNIWYVYVVFWNAFVLPIPFIIKCGTYNPEANGWIPTRCCVNCCRRFNKVCIIAKGKNTFSINIYRINVLRTVCFMGWCSVCISIVLI